MGRRFWTKEEEKILREMHCSGHSCLEIGEVLNRSKDSVNSKRRSLGLKSILHGAWSDEEIEVLKQLCEEGGNPHTIARRLNRTTNALKHKAKELGMKVPLSPNANRSWTDEDLATLRRLGPTMPRPELAEKLGRTEHAVRAMGQKLGIDLWSYNTYREWSDEEIRYLTDNAEFKSTQELKEGGLPDRTLNAIQKRASDLGLSVGSKRGGQGYAWTDKENSTLRQFFPHSSYEEIARVLPNRTANAVKEQAYRMGLRKQVPAQEWTPDEIETVRKYVGRTTVKKISNLVNRTPGAVYAKARKMGLSTRLKGYTLSDLKMLFNVEGHDLGFDQHEFERWKKAGLSYKDNGSHVVTAQQLRTFWKMKPEACDIYALHEDTLWELGINIDYWPEPPSFKLVACSGREGRPHDISLMCVLLYEDNLQCPHCGSFLPRWACAYTETEVIGAYTPKRVRDALRKMP